MTTAIETSENQTKFTNDADTTYGIERNVLSKQAYSIIRSRILKGELKQGQQLIVRLLSDELNLSPTPIKSALTTLEQEGLLESIPYRGFFVPEFKLADLEEIFSLRSVLEALATELAAQKANSQVHETLQSLIASQKASIQTNDTEAYGDIDMAFHNTIAEAAQHKRLQQNISGLQGHARLLIVDSVRSIRRQDAILSEHRAIADAIKQGDADAANKASKQHTENTYNSLVKLFNETERS